MYLNYIAFDAVCKSSKLLPHTLHTFRVRGRTTICCRQILIFFRLFVWVFCVRTFDLLTSKEPFCLLFMIRFSLHRRISSPTGLMAPNPEHVLPLNYCPPRILRRCDCKALDSPSLQLRRKPRFLSTVIFF